MVAYALDLRGMPPERRPDLMLLISDQVYADEVGPPHPRVADFTKISGAVKGHARCAFHDFTLISAIL